jgi:hypothetical protein
MVIPRRALPVSRERLRIYPLSAVANRPAMNFVNVSGKAFNTIHSMNFSFFEEVNEVIQEEPADAMDPETRSRVGRLGAGRQREQLGSDLAGQRMERHPSPVRSAAAVFRQDVATG